MAAGRQQGLRRHGPSDLFLRTEGSGIFAISCTGIPPSPAVGTMPLVGASRPFERIDWKNQVGCEIRHWSTAQRGLSWCRSEQGRWICRDSLFRRRRPDFLVSTDWNGP